MEDITKVYGIFEVYKDHDEFEHEKLTACFLSEENAKSECEYYNITDKSDTKFIFREIPLCDC